MRTGAADRQTRRAFDVVAEDYGRLLPDLAAESALDRAVLAAFVEMVIERSGEAAVVDVGCGTGRVTAYLAAAGLHPLGVDLSGGMIDVARARHPHIPFAVGHAATLPLQPATMAGLVAWYSLINLSARRLVSATAEFARVVLPGAPVVLAFQSGSGEREERTTSYGHPVSLTYYRHEVGEVTRALTAAGFAVHATVDREPRREHETTRQAFVLAHRA